MKEQQTVAPATVAKPKREPHTKHRRVTPMLSTILSEKVAERKAGEASAIEHCIAGIRFCNVGAGYDCEVACSCSEVAFGYSERGQREAYTRAVEHFHDHCQAVAEHSQRCPSDFGLEVR